MKCNVPFEYKTLYRYTHLHGNEKKDPQLKQPKQKDKEHCVEVGFNNEIEIIFFYIFFWGATVDTIINQWVI